MNRGKLLLKLALNNAGNKNDCVKSVCEENNATTKERYTSKQRVLSLPLFSENGGSGSAENTSGLFNKYLLVYFVKLKLCFI